jgi:hypothetical protein
MLRRIVMDAIYKLDFWRNNRPVEWYYEAEKSECSSEQATVGPYNISKWSWNVIDLAKWTRYSILVSFQGLLTDFNLCSYSVDLYNCHHLMMPNLWKERIMCTVRPFPQPISH